MITIEQFKSVELKVGRILSVTEHPNADRLYVVEVDLGAERRTVVAGIRKFYTPDQLVGKLVIVAANLELATIRGVASNGMLLAAHDAERLSVLTVDTPLQLGSLVS